MQHHIPNRFRSLGAFTLVEMLVVLAVIGILAGLILPALASARRAARRTNCISNLDQIGKTLAIYCNNSNDYLPSYYAYGSPDSHMGPESDPDVQLYPGHQAASRHMVIGYSKVYKHNLADPSISEKDTALAPDQVNFMPVGLGILVWREELQDPRVLDCPSMRSEVTTWYGSAEYRYDPLLWRKLGGELGKRFIQGDGRELFSTGVDQDPLTLPEDRTCVSAMLSSYSYRNTPFYCLSRPDNYADCPEPPNVDPADWTDATDEDFDKFNALGELHANGWVAEWDIKIPDLDKVVTRAEFMTPPFKTRRQLKGRAIVADTFDYADPAGSSADFGEDSGLVRQHHRNGYNVCFGDGHVVWYEDGSDRIRGWTKWYDPEDTGTPPWPDTDNLTISSHSSNYVWNAFDRLEGLDVK